MIGVVDGIMGSWRARGIKLGRLHELCVSIAHVDGRRTNVTSLNFGRGCSTT